MSLEHAPTPDRFRSAMSRFVTGVVVMTSVGDDGEPHAMTANAVTSVSLDPALILVCVDRDATMAEVVADADHFALSVLSLEQQALSSWFADATRPEGAAQFEGVDLADHDTASPVLADALAWFDCRVWARYDGGDHVIVVGEVIALAESIDREAEPLVFDRGRYTRVVDEAG